MSNTTERTKDNTFIAEHTKGLELLKQNRYIDGLALLKETQKEIKKQKNIRDTLYRTKEKEQYHIHQGYLGAAHLLENKILAYALKNNTFEFDFRKEVFNIWGSGGDNDEKFFHLTTKNKTLRLVLTKRQFFIFLDLLLSELEDKFEDYDSIDDLFEYIRYSITEEDE